MSFGDITVQVPYTTMAQANKLRAWCRKNGATVRLSRYARDAYEGEIVVHSGPCDPYAVTAGKATAARAYMVEIGVLP